MKKRIPFLILTLLLGLSLLPLPAGADSGPKPSTRIDFQHLEGGPCWATLLSREPSTGPDWVWDGTEADARHNGNPDYAWSDLDPETWAAFVAYEDPDGYYFLQEAWEISRTREVPWVYYPPGNFKVLLYWPETGVFQSSGPAERRAVFHAQYSVDLDETEADGTLILREQYRLLYELPGLLGRMALTILVELGVALLFGLRGKPVLGFIAGANVLTQLLLNVSLLVPELLPALYPVWTEGYGFGAVELLYWYLPLECLVVLVEAALYVSLLRKRSGPEREKRFYYLYALAANAASFAAGLLLAPVLPGLF